MNDTKLDFYQSYEIIDIWREFNTKTGKEKFAFWFNNKPYERETHGEIIALAKQLLAQKGSK